MTKTEIDSSLFKSKGQVVLEYILLAICLCVIALRSTFTEGLSTQSANQPVSFSDSLYSLSISAVLIFSFFLWLMFAVFSDRFLYRLTGMEIGLCFFSVAAIIAGIFASDKRTAITDSICLISPLLMGVLLVQILDSTSKIKVVLAVIAALGVVSAYQCAEQFFVSNQIMIDQYEQAPETILEPLGIEPGSFAQMLFEHRLYSRGVNGFFSTRNSAGSFSMMAVFAVLALYVEKLRNGNKFLASDFRYRLAYAIVVMAVLFGLVVTRSKGAIAASLVAGVMFIAWQFFGKIIKTHKKSILTGLLLAALVGGSAFIWYGFTHKQLPGGSSMLVRWQYWGVAVKMYAGHWLTGIGPGNFRYFYPHYKPDAALESVADPHNFLLSVLSQYGPAGLVGFLAMIFMPLWKVIFSKPSPVTGSYPERRVWKLALFLTIIISAGLMIIRPVIMPVIAKESLDAMIYGIFKLYVAPAAVFALVFWFLAANEKTAKTSLTSVTTVALFCVVFGVLLHNLTDFAIFEPGVYTVFWTVVACLIALDSYQKSRSYFVLKHNLFAKILMTAAVLALIWAYLNYAIIPVAKSTAKMQKAHHLAFAGQFQRAHNLLADAAMDDFLSPAALSLNGRIYLHHFEVTGRGDQDLLISAKDSLLEAIKRNPADFKNFERLTEVYVLLAESSTLGSKTDLLNKAFDAAMGAVERYPGLGRLRISLAEIAEQLDKTDIAIEQYQKAVKIEDRYRHQFEIMYPGRPIFNRLGEEKYNFALRRIRELSEKSKD